MKPAYINVPNAEVVSDGCLALVRVSKQREHPGFSLEIQSGLEKVAEGIFYSLPGEWQGSPSCRPCVAQGMDARAG